MNGYWNGTVSIKQPRPRGLLIRGWHYPMLERLDSWRYSGTVTWKVRKCGDRIFSRVFPGDSKIFGFLKSREGGVEIISGGCFSIRTKSLPLVGGFKHLSSPDDDCVSYSSAGGSATSQQSYLIQCGEPNNQVFFGVVNVAKLQGIAFNWVYLHQKLVFQWQVPIKSPLN